MTFETGHHKFDNTMAHRDTPFSRYRAKRYPQVMTSTFEPMIIEITFEFLAKTQKEPIVTVRFFNTIPIAIIMTKGEAEISFQLKNVLC
jgi:hypothetical protein